MGAALSAEITRGGGGQTSGHRSIPLHITNTYPSSPSCIVPFQFCCGEPQAPIAFYVSREADVARIVTHLQGPVTHGFQAARQRWS